MCYRNGKLQAPIPTSNKGRFFQNSLNLVAASPYAHNTAKNTHETLQKFFFFVASPRPTGNISSMGSHQQRVKLVRRIIYLVGRGLTNREIGERVGLSHRSVESILYRLRQSGVVVNRPKPGVLR